MTTQETIYRIVDVEVESATQAVRQINGEDHYVWNLKLKAPSMSKFALPCSMPAEWTDRVVQDQKVRVKLRRGRLKEKDGQTEDGSRDYHYWWDLDEWDTKEQAPVSQGNTGPGGDRSDIFRLKEELRWTEAWHIVSRMGWCDRSTSVEEMRTAALEIYNELENPPEPSSPEPQQSARVEQPEQTTSTAPVQRPTFCDAHHLHFSDLHRGNGNRYHMFTGDDGEEYACVDTGEVVPVPKKR